MSARYVPAEMLRTVLDEIERDCTLDRFHEWYRAQIAVEIRQRIPQPKADKWDVFGNRSITYRFNEACAKLIKETWASHRRVVRERIEAMIDKYAEQHDVQYGDELIREAGGSTAEVVAWMLAQVGSTDGHMPQYRCGEGRCPCAFQDRAKERERTREAARALVTGESFAKWVTDSIDRITVPEAPAAVPGVEADQFATEIVEFKKEEVV